jgi:hypothetical protein
MFGENYDLIDGKQGQYDPKIERDEEIFHHPLNGLLLHGSLGVIHDIVSEPGLLELLQAMRHCRLRD